MVRALAVWAVLTGFGLVLDQVFTIPADPLLIACGAATALLGAGWLCDNPRRA